MSATGTAAVYVRISSDPEGERAGVERQRLDCEALAARLGLDVVATFEDNDRSAYSGRTRPAFEAMMAAAAEGDFEHVICWASDRLYRRLADLVRITSELAPHARIHTVMGGEVDLTTADGIMQAQILGSVAEHESRRKGERLTARARQRAEVDRRPTTGRRVTGWRWADPCPGGSDCQHPRPCSTDGRRPRLGSRAGLVPDPFEADLLRAAYADVRKGLSLAESWRRATAAGLRVSDPTTLRAALINPVQAGYVTYHGAIVGDSANGLSVIDRDTFEAVRAILTDPARRTTPGRPVATVLGGGLLKCGRCGGNMSALNDGYRCGACKGLQRKRAPLDAAVIDAAGHVLAAMSTRGLLTVDRAEDDKGRALRAEVADVENRLQTLGTMVGSGDLDPADYGIASKALRGRLDALTKRLGRTVGRPALAHLAGTPGGVGAAWAALVADGDPAELRAVLRELLAGIVIDAEGLLTVEWAEWVGVPASIIDPRPGRKTMSKATRRERVADMYRDGANIGQIAEALGCYRATISKDLDALGLRDIPTRKGSAA